MNRLAAGGPNNGGDALAVGAELDFGSSAEGEVQKWGAWGCRARPSYPCAVVPRGVQERNFARQEIR